ncbi:MazG nucleotide pyrophosphohydrolase domain-containing protein [Terrisporobacter sp.]|uniref:MazG nucleotide pyrophosphohydrolase domain-containing protein n=1 Tax=Terrisporobacter sp. TaxID=1965305 RepID=UPI00261EA1C3|nr:MazG nucleotide pyrophosphohydrolase domain-containing protein [Terrisporobacter sp.]
MEYNNYMQAVEVDKDLCTTIAMEECSELIQAISKGKRGKLDKDNLAEEIADVRICMSWLMNIFNIEFEEVNKWIDFKEDRITKRLNKGEFK